MSNLQKYQANIEQMRKSIYMDYPAHVHMETMAQCNAACNFCPYPTLDRKGAKMPDDLIDKIINDLAQIPANVPFQLSPFKINEPFLDKRLFPILKKINNRLPNAYILLTTNASPITEETIEKLGYVKNLKSLWISFNDHREAEYEATMQLPYKRTIERLNLIHKFKKLDALNFDVYLSRVGDNSQTDLDFREWVRVNYPGFNSNIFPRGNWLNQVSKEFTKQAEIPDVGCVRWFDFSITATGVVAHCCMDGKAEFPIGDVNNNSVLEIYNSPHYKALREAAIYRKNAEPCNKCSFL